MIQPPSPRIAAGIVVVYVAFLLVGGLLCAANCLLPDANQEQA